MYYEMDNVDKSREVFEFLTLIANRSNEETIRLLKSRYIGEYLLDVLDGTSKSIDMQDEIILLADEVLKRKA